MSVIEKSSSDQIHSLGIKELESLLGSEGIETDSHECAAISHDVYSGGHAVEAIVRPVNVDQLSEIVRIAVNNDIDLIPRGGGMSYTSGYVPITKRSVMIDMRRMNRLLELNLEDMYVTVEAGMTWSELYDLLRDTEVRTPYWGTLSGRFASVGGGMSQNSIFWGSGQFGTAVDNVLSMDVVLPDGSVIRTGSAAQVNASPFFRHYGPDLTGMFCCDCGALGVKASITLRLIPRLSSKAFGSFKFNNSSQMIAAMSEISRRGLAMECFGFDPYLQSQRLKRESISRDAEQFIGVLKSAGGVVEAVKEGAKVAFAGRRFMQDVGWSFHVMIEERVQTAADICLSEVRKIVRDHEGDELTDSIPKLVRANPFGPVNNMIGPAGERWAPVHGLFPHSTSAGVLDKIEELFGRFADDIDKYEVGTGYLLATVSTNCMVIEPVFFWPDELQEVHRRHVEKKHLAGITEFQGNEEARNFVAKLRKLLIDLLQAEGGVHMQLGKAYPFQENLHPENKRILIALKKEIDPMNRMNPGALGLI